MVNCVTLTILLLASVTAQHDASRQDASRLKRLDQHSANTTIIASNIGNFGTGYSTSSKLRYKRESHPLIGPFDISKMYKKRNRLKKEGASQPTASPLLSDDILRERQLAVSQAIFMETVDRKTEVKTESLVTEGLAMRVEDQHKHAGNREAKASTNNQTTIESETSEDSFINVVKENDTKSAVTNKPVNKISDDKVERKSSVYSESITGKIVGDTKKLQVKSVKNAKTKNKVTRKSKSVVTSKPPTDQVMSSFGEDSRGDDVAVITKKKADNESVWPVKHAAVLEGDIILGGLMMVGLFMTIDTDLNFTL